MSNVLISVIMPVYNAEIYLKNSIESVLNQDFNDYELLIIDDASTDNSLSICNSYAGSSNKIKVIAQEANQGQSAARNIGIENSRGKYLCFVDSDDCLCQNALSTIVTEMENNGLDVFGYNACTISDDKERPYVISEYSNTILSGSQYLMRMLNVDGFFYDTVWIYAVSKNLIINNSIRFIEGRIFEDEIWTAEILLAAGSAMYRNVRLYTYYSRPNSTMTRQDINEKKFEDKVKNCEKLVTLSDKLSENDKKLFLDYIARMYMSGTRYLGFTKAAEAKIDKKFIRSLINTRQTKIKYFVFSLNRRLFFKIKEGRK